MVAVSQGVSNDMSKLGYPRDRSICLQSLPSISHLYGLETRSSQSSKRCSPTEMEKRGTSICFPPFLIDRKSSLKSQGRGINNDSGNSKLACTTLVQSNSRSVHNRAFTPTPISGTFGRSQGTKTSSSVQQDFKTNDLENFRKNLFEKVISNTAANLISNSRGSGTTANYQSAWKKWVSWCSEGQIDPVTCSINFMLHFLGNLFENKYEYSTLNAHRSAISAYHNLVERTGGQHISVCNLMTGVFNKNPPKPKYTFISNVEKVLKSIKTLPTNTELSGRTLLLNLTSLLFLTSAGRYHKICYLGTCYMVKTFRHTNFIFQG